MAKNRADKDVVLDNLKGFVRKGASSNIRGCVPTGHFKLDYVIHHGVLPDNVDLNEDEDYDPSKSLGIPLGKVVELFGEEGGGKSSLAYRIVGYAQKMDLKCAWIDTERSFSDNLARINGVDRDEVYYSDMSNPNKPDEPYYAEHVFDNILVLCESGIDVIVLDSVANLVPKARMDAKAEDIKVALLARLMSENMGKVVNYAAKNNTMVVFINQLRHKIGIMFGSPETTPGGRSLKHNASLRIQISKKNSKDSNIYRVDDSGKQVLIGSNARINIRKNRFAKPYLESMEIPIYYEPYFPDVEEIIFDVGRQVKLISVYKGIFKWNDIKIEGRKDFIACIKMNDMTMELAKAVVEAAKEAGVILPPEITQWMKDNNSDTKKKDKKVDEKSQDEGSSSGARKKKDSNPSSSGTKSE